MKSKTANNFNLNKDRNKIFLNTLDHADYECVQRTFMLDYEKITSHTIIKFYYCINYNKVINVCVCVF